MPDYLDAARAENFTGRRWLYEEIEDAFKDKYIAGVQIVGSPGSGKSALSSQLICSRSSSPIIHNSILGYHFCKYSDKNTQMAGKFVLNLAEMIARRLPEYGYLVSNNSFKHSLKEDCIHYQDPVGCFQRAVLSPLRNLTNKPRENWFVVLDALDECITQGETGHSIVYLLNNKIHLFPPWFKVIVTLRNESEAFLRSSKVKTIVIDPEDSRNLEDLEIFVTTRLLQETPLLHPLTWWFGDDSVKSVTKLITEVLSKSQGNFLFVNELLNNWEQTTTELRNVFDLPKSLGNLFYAYFKRLYPSEESFKSVRHILELLVSTFEPLKRKQIFKLLKTGENSLDEYDFKNRLRGLSHFLQYGKDNNTLTLYHLSLTEWLTSEENEEFFVIKRKGHETFCEYYIGLIRETEESKLSGYILNLAQHIALSGMKEAFVQEFINLPSQTVNASDPQNNRTLLHRAATINNSGALGLVLRHFSCIDCVDDRGITPAFLAAEHGLVDNLALLVEKGAEINRKTKTMAEFNKGRIIQALQQAINNESDISAANRVIDMSFHQSKSKLFDSSLLYAAAQGGHTSVVHYLINNSACISMLNGGHLTAIQIAAENGHLEVVKTLSEEGAVVDKTVLFLAAADNRLEVVNFLLDIGVKDDCRTINRFKVEKRIFLGLLLPDPDETNTVCDGEDDIGPCSTKHDSALAAAVASGNDKVVSLLRSQEHNAVNCSVYSGSAPLDEDDQENNRVNVDIILGRRPLVTYFHYNSKRRTFVLPSDFTESGAIECRKPLNYSVFHLLSYLSSASEYNNAFNLSERCIKLDEHSISCREIKGPLAEGVDRYSGKEWIISSCFDAEGFTPLHRAAQGANLAAIRYFLNTNGIDTSILSQNGHDALTLAVLHAGRRRLWEREGRVAVDADHEHLILADQAAIRLLHHAVNGGFKVRCNSSKPDLSLYHLAASRGLVKFIETLFNESDLHHLDVDCANSDGITPIYLANLFQQRVQDGLDNPWKKVIQIIKQRGGEMRYPREDAEYNLIYNGVYGWILYECTLDLSDMIKHFITSFLTSYEKSENKSFRCSFGRNLDLARENYHHDWLVTWLWRKISDTVGPVIKPSEEDMSTSKRGTGPHLSRERARFRRDMTRCSLHVTQFRRYLSKLMLHKQAYPKNILKNDNWETFSKAQRNWFQKELLILMKIRHTEVFRAFACLKSLSSRLKPVYHLDARSATYSVRQYEKNPPVDNYLNSICDSLQYVFESYISFRISSQEPSEFRLRENEFFSRSGFFNGPVKVSRQASVFGSNPIEWPLEFFLRRSLGFFRRYDYLKTLHIGIEPRTYVHLYPDKIRQLMNRDKMLYDHA